MALSTFLTDPTETQFRTDISASSQHGVVRCWPEVIKYLLCTYETLTTISDASENLQSILQAEDELGEDYHKTLNEAIQRCCNIHKEDENITMYIDRMYTIVQKTFSCSHEGTPRRVLTFEEIAHFAHYEDDAVRAGAPKNHQFIHNKLTWPQRGAHSSSLPSQ